ncbi:hypothetical protein KJ784_01255, partial [Patescibacteria group bacterium]|nr:hypothetical protein [Patescibacteria group bacterium]
FDTGKDPQKLLEMLSIIKFVPAPALQTLTPAVLTNINRKNLPLDDYIKFQREILLKTGENSMSELILCLPGETKETFLDTVRKVINSGVQNIVIYTLIKLTGTPLDSEEFSKKYNYVLRYRVVPRQISVINGKKILETEEVIIGTKDMSFEDYLELRGLYFTVSIFSGSVELSPLKKFLLENKVDLAQWLFNIHDRLKNYPDIYYWYQEFLKETREELFNSRQKLLDFFEKQENFEDLISGRRGDNLLRKYKHLVLSECYPAYLRIAIFEAQEIMNEFSNIKKKKEIINDLALYLSTRDLQPVFQQQDIINEPRNFCLKYDIPRWLAGGNDKTNLLDNFEKTINYAVVFTKEQRKALKHLDTHKNPILSLQIFYRDGHSKDLWPKWNLA